MNATLIQLAFLLVYSLLVAFYFIVVTGKSLFPTGTTLFLLQQSMTFVGTIILIEAYGLDVGVERLLFITVGMWMFVLGAAIANRAKRFKPKVGIRRFLQNPIYFDLHSGVYWLMIGMAIVSIVVSLIYLSNLGSVVLLNTLRTYLSSGSLTESRLAYSAGRKTVHNSAGIYLASGYAFQFIATLLPTVVFLMYARMEFLHKRNDRIIFVTLFLIAVFGLAIPGNRLIIMNFFLIFFLLTSKRWGPFGIFQKSHWWRITIPVIALGIFAGVTVLAGRVGVVSTLGKGLAAGLSDLFTRAFLVTAGNQLFFQRVFDYSGLRWGLGWLQSLSNIIPGISRFSYNTQLALLLYGNTGSNTPPDFWSSTFWNFDWFGVILVPLLTGYLLQRYAIGFFTGRKALSRIVIIFVSFFALREITDPYDYFNNGFVTLIIFFTLVVIVKHSYILYKRFSSLGIKIEKRCFSSSRGRVKLSDRKLKV
jgi:hypothetical protein